MNRYNEHKIKTGTVLKDAVGSFEYKVKLSPNIEITDEGYLIARNAVVGNIGELQYSERELGWSNSNKKVRVLREETDVFDEDSLASLEAKPITILHPKGNVDSENIRDLGKGTVLGVPKRVGDNMVVDIVVQDKEAVDLIAPEDENGVRKLNDSFRDLSLGYKAKLVEVALGLYKQTDIRYNHLALVPQGRQVNATIVDELQKEVETKMGILDKIFKKGNKVVRGENGEITITDENVEVLNVELEDEIIREFKEKSVEKRQSWDDPNKDTIITRETTVVEEKVDKKEKTSSTILDEVKPNEKESETMVKDRKYFQDEFIRLSALEDSVIKVDALRELEKEFLDTFPQPTEDKNLKDSLTVVETSKLDESFKDETPKAKSLKFDEIVRAKSEYYMKLTNPLAHNSWKEFNDNYKNESRKGRNEYLSI